jgi:hypothetical protein
VRRRTALAVAALAVPAVLATTAQATGRAVPATTIAQSVARVGAFVSAHAGAGLPHRDATISGNWAGWVVQPGGPVTGVQSTFTVPTAKFTPPGFSASWAGIGGYNTKDLIQAGTTSDSIGAGLPRYYAWMEVLPASEGLLVNCTGDTHCTVHPGDRMSVDIHGVGTNLWSVSVANSGHWTWHLNVHYVSSRSSAEWILEAPTVGAQTTIAQVGAAYFGTVSNYTASGVKHTIAAGHPVKVNLAGFEAVTSNLAPNQQSFRVCTYKLKCAPPAR